MKDASKPVQVGMIGCGGRAGVHAMWAAHTPLVKIATWLDVQREKAEQFAAKYGGRVANTYEEVLDDAGVEAVVIALPHSLHHEFGVKAARAGKHIAMEIPIAMTLEQADNLLAEVKRAGVLLLVLHSWRFRWPFRYIKKLLDSGILGKPFLVRYHAEHYVPGDHFARQPGAFAAEAGVLHSGDLMRWWIGEVQGLTARGLMIQPQSQQYQLLDHITVLYDLAGNALGETTTNWVTRYNELNQAICGSVSCTEGTVVLTGNEEVRVYSERGALPGGEKLLTVTEKSVKNVATEGEIVHFVECVRNGKPPMITAQESRRALELMLAARESTRTGKRIEFTGSTEHGQRD